MIPARIALSRLTWWSNLFSVCASGEIFDNVRLRVLTRAGMNTSWTAWPLDVASHSIILWTGILCCGLGWTFEFKLTVSTKGLTW